MGHMIFEIEEKEKISLSLALIETSKSYLHLFIWYHKDAFLYTPDRS